MIRPEVARLVGPELERLNAVAALGQMGTPPEERFDRITKLARSIFGVPIAQINFLDDERQFTKSPQVEGESSYLPRNESFCDVTLTEPDILVVPDATRDERFASREPVVGDRHMRFYAGLPLTVDGGQRVGSFCIIDTKPRDFDAEERAVLAQLVQLVEHELRRGTPAAASD